MTATAPLHDASPQPALFESLLELIRRTSTQLPETMDSHGQSLHQQVFDESKKRLAALKA